jgi:hypothetical protein
MLLVVVVLTLFIGGADLGTGDASADAPTDAGADADAADTKTAADGGGAVASPPVIAPGPGPAVVLAPLSGTLWEKGTRRRLVGVSIAVDALSAGESDESGSFAIAAPPGRHMIQFQLPGFELLQAAIDVPAAGTNLSWRLSRRWGDRRYETVVSAPGQPAKITLSGEEARSTPGAAGDPFRSIESLPGVAQIAWPLALYAIRGANPGNTGFFLDGMRVPALFHFALGPSVIHPYLIERIDFYPGGYPARFGGYVSGVVAAESMSPPTDMAHASVDVRLYDAGGLVTSPFDKGRGTVAIAGRYSYTAAIAGLFLSGVQLGYDDYQIRAEHPLAGGHATVLAMGSADDLSLRVREVGDGALQFHRMDVRWDRALGPGRLRLRSTFGADWARSNFRDAPISIGARSVAPRVDYNAPLGAGVQLESGVSLDAQRFDPRIPPMVGSATFDDLARRRGAVTAAVFASLALAFGRSVEISPGARVVKYFEQGVSRTAPEPRLNARWMLSERLSLKAGFGQFTQMASLPVGVPGFDAFDLRDLGLQRSTQGSLGGALKLGDLGLLELTGFYQQLRVSDVRSTFASDFRQQSFLEMRPGRGYGLELLLRRPEGHRLHGWLAYTRSRSERRVDGVWGASDWDQPHILNLLASYRLARGYSVGGRVHYNTGRPYPIPLPGNMGQVEYQRLPAFYQLDLRAEKRMLFDRFTLTAYLELGNVTLTREVTGLSSMFDNNGRALSDGRVGELGYRIVLPSLGVHGEM